MPSGVKALSPSFINNVSTKAFEKTIVDIFRNTCLSLWAMAEKLKNRGHLTEYRVPLNCSWRGESDVFS